MPICGNPECNKKLPEGRAYCNEECLRRYFALKSSKRGNLRAEEDIWRGTSRRRQTMDTISRLANELLPMSEKKWVSMISYRTGLSRRKVADDYLVVLIDVGIIELRSGVLSVVEVTSTYDVPVAEPGEVS